MLKHLVISGLTVLTLFAASLMFNGSTYSQINLAMYNQYTSAQISPNARAYAPDYVWTIHTNGFINSDYASLPSDPYYKYMTVSNMYVPDNPATEPYAGNTVAARATYVTTQDIRISNSNYVLYRNYVRPSDREAAEEINYLPVVTTPSVNGNTATLVAPHGYKYHQVKTKPVHPVRDFRTEFWEDKYYRDEFHNQASYNKTYGAYNYWNSAGSNESAGTPFGSKD